MYIEKELKSWLNEFKEFIKKLKFIWINIPHIKYDNKFYFIKKINGITLFKSKLSNNKRIIDNLICIIQKLDNNNIIFYDIWLDNIILYKNNLYLIDLDNKDFLFQNEKKFYKWVNIDYKNDIYYSIGILFLNSLLNIRIYNILKIFKIFCFLKIVYKKLLLEWYDSNKINLWILNEFLRLKKFWSKWSIIKWYFIYILTKIL